MYMSHEIASAQTARSCANPPDALVSPWLCERTKLGDVWRGPVDRPGPGIFTGQGKAMGLRVAVPTVCVLTIGELNDLRAARSKGRYTPCRSKCRTFP